MFLMLLVLLSSEFALPACFYDPPSRKRPIESALPHVGPMPRYSTDTDVRADLPAPYRIGRSDVLEVKVRDLDEFGGELEVDREGKVRLPTLDDDLVLEGMTVEQAERTVSDALAPFAVGPPKVRIKVKQAGSKFFYAYGAIAAQGRQPMGEEAISLRDALIRVGLFRPGAASWTTYIITPHPTDPTHVIVDARDLLLGKTAENIQIKPDDVIFVPTSAYSRYNQVLREMLFQFSQGVNADTMVQYIEKRLQPGSAPE